MRFRTSGERDNNTYSAAERRYLEPRAAKYAAFFISTIFPESILTAKGP
jgi:hypothetical protein